MLSFAYLLHGLSVPTGTLDDEGFPLLAITSNRPSFFSADSLVS